MEDSCLNCGTPLTGKFCHQCGQKASTHRFTFKKFVEHDLIHGILHLDRGILFTFKKLFFKPGHTARYFLQGRRVGHYSILALFIIVIALKTYLDSISGYDFVITSEDNPEGDRNANRVIEGYYKLLYLLIIPVMALFTFLLFRRPRYNYIEHIVASGFLVTSAYIYALIVSLLNLIFQSPYLALGGTAVLIPVYILGVYQLFKPHYRFWSWLWRLLLVIVLALVTLVLSLALFIRTVWGEFRGNVTYETYTKKTEIKSP